MEISVSDLMNLNNMNIIDIRNGVKYEKGHIDGAINIPYDELVSNHSKYLNFNDLYCIYCQKGVTSRVCMQILGSFGYKVYSLIGGYDAYILNKRL